LNSIKVDPHTYDCGNEESKASVRNCMKIECDDDTTRYDTRSCHRYVSDIAAHIGTTSIYMGKKKVPDEAIISTQNIGTNDWAKCYGYCMKNEISEAFQFDKVTSNCSCIKNHAQLKNSNLMYSVRHAPDHKELWIFETGVETSNEMVIGIRDGPFNIFGGEYWSCGGHFQGNTENCGDFLDENNRLFFGPTEAFDDNDNRLCESNNALPLENISISYPQDPSTS